MVKNFDIEQFRIFLHTLFQEIADWIRGLK